MLKEWNWWDNWTLLVRHSTRGPWGPCAAISHLQKHLRPLLSFSPVETSPASLPSFHYFSSRCSGSRLLPRNTSDVASMPSLSSLPSLPWSRSRCSDDHLSPCRTTIIAKTHSPTSLPPWLLLMLLDWDMRRQENATHSHRRSSWCCDGSGHN